MRKFVKLMSAVLTVAVIGSMSAAFSLPASAANTIVWEEKFDNAKLPKAYKVINGDGFKPQEVFTCTNNQGLLDLWPDAPYSFRSDLFKEGKPESEWWQKAIMIKDRTNTETSIVYQFKKGFSSFEYIGVGGGGAGFYNAGIYSRRGYFKIYVSSDNKNWKQITEYTFKDEENTDGGVKYKTNPPANTMWNYIPNATAGPLAYFKCTDIKLDNGETPKYLKLWFVKGSDEEGVGKYYERWRCGLGSLKVTAVNYDGIYLDSDYVYESGQKKYGDPVTKKPGDSTTSSGAVASNPNQNTPDPEPDASEPESTASGSEPTASTPASSSESSEPVQGTESTNLPSDEDKTADQESNPGSQEASKDNTGGSLLWLWIVLGIIVVAGGGAAAAILLIRKKKQQQEKGGN